jgi:hypothetical protein
MRIPLSIFKARSGAIEKEVRGCGQSLMAGVSHATRRFRWSGHSRRRSAPL